MIRVDTEISMHGLWKKWTLFEQKEKMSIIWTKKDNIKQ
jgi:hypothetical protein